MPGDREAYETAMREAANAAWDHHWESAIEAYQTALAEFPENAFALSGMGMALVEAGRLEHALDVYQRAVKLAPDDPLSLEKTADVLERLGRGEEAAKQYVAVAEIYLSQRNIERTIANWERAASLVPDDVKLRSRLAVAYERTKMIPKAVREYMSLAAIFQNMQDLSKAAQALQRALNIDPTNEQVRNSLTSLRSGSAVDLSIAPEPKQARRDGGFDALAADAPEDVERPTPIEESADKAMSALAELLFEGDLSEGAQSAVSQAIEQQRAGDLPQAAEYYEQALSKGLNDPAGWFNAGLAYHQMGDARKTENALGRVTASREYGLAANLIMGRLYVESEKWDRAARHLVEALRYADLTTRGGDEAATNAVYDATRVELEEQNEERLRGLSEALVDMLDSTNWRRALMDLQNQMEEGQSRSLIDTLLEPGAGKVSVLVKNIDEYVVRGMLLLAMEEAHYAVEVSPLYLPVHARMAEILTKSGRLTAAAEKYNIIAGAYMVRGEREKAADMFAEVLQLDPMDLAARQRVIEMLVEQGRLGQALKHYEEMAEVYLLMADTENARQAYQEAIAQAQQSEVEPTRIAQLLYRVADLDAQRLDWRQALRSYEQATELVPGDERANLAIVDLYFRLGEPGRAVDQLDAYLSYCLQSGLSERVVTILEEQVRNRPDEIPLRQRLARVYQEQKRVPEAIAQMDALGELLLEAGRAGEAVETISRIVALNPPDVDGYRQLLRQIEGSRTENGG